jgi:GDP-L-fucose synthase
MIEDKVQYTPGKLDRNATFYVAGHRGLVGSAIVRKLEAEGFTNIVGKTSKELDLKDRDAVFEYMAEIKPRYLVLAAAKVGGILANSTYPVEFLSENLQIQVNVLDAALKENVERVLFLGSSCIYPKFAEQPIREDSLLTGHLEPTNDAYAIAKIAGILHVQAVRREYGLPWISAMPTNLYGPNDNFSPKGSHVLPALVRRYSEAVESGSQKIINWGTGNPRRELLHSDDLADACLFLLENYDGSNHVNVGSGFDSSISQIAQVVSDTVGYRGAVEWDSSKPDGTPQKLLSNTTLQRLGWMPKIGLEQGIESVVKWYRLKRDELSHE